MAEVDTSSYPKATLPVQKSALDQAQQLGAMQQQQQQIESGKLTIDKQKLDLVNQRFGEMSKGFAALIADPDLNSNTFRQYVQHQVKLGYIDPQMADTTLTIAPQDPKQLRGFLQTQIQHAQTVVDAINTHFGTTAQQSDNANTYTGIQQSPMKGGQFIPTTTTPQQLAPNQPIQSPTGKPGFVGPSGPAGPQPFIPTPRVRPGLPVATPAAPVAPPTSGPTGDTIYRGSEFDNRFGAAFPNAIAAGPEPGVAAAKAVVGEQSGKDYASDLSKANNYQTELYPAQRILKIIDDQGENAFGKGTDTLNDIKNAMVTWLPNASKAEIDNVASVAEAKKLMVQNARGSGNTGTNDQLAAAFSGNPNTTMTGATIKNVLKSQIALRKMQMAQTLLFGQTGQPESEYSKWISKNQNVLDPRAFGFDIMDKDAQKKLLDSFTEKDGDSKEMKAAKAAAYTKFGRSLKFAHDANLIGQ